MNRLESEYIQHWLELGETFGDMLRVQSHLADYRIDVWDTILTYGTLVLLFSRPSDLGSYIG